MSHSQKKTQNFPPHAYDKDYKLETYENAPLFLRDNEYIKKGYRTNFNSIKRILRSLFMIHNESVNVWTHLIGALFVVILTIYTVIFIRSHKDEIITKFQTITTEMNDFASPIWNQIPSKIHNLTDDFFESSYDYVHNKTNYLKLKLNEYVDEIDQKLIYYKKVINEKMNCLECLRDLPHALKDLKNVILNIDVEKFYQDSINKLKDNSSLEYLNAIKEKITMFRNEILEKLELSNNSNTSSVKIEKWPLYCFLFGAITCLSCSSIFHLFCALSPKTHDFLSRLDYAGISILIAGSCYSPYYYFFYCHEHLRIFYLTFITVFALVCFFASLWEQFSIPKYRWLRGVLFLMLGISAGVPVIHLMIIGNQPGMIPNGDFSMWILGGVTYISGALIYINRFPEKIWPGKFCFFGNSHQIWHCFVLGGVIFHYFGCILSYRQRLEYPNCPA